jgi:DNA ligase 1
METSVIETNKTWPTLYKRTSTGKVQTWTIEVKQIPYDAYDVNKSDDYQWPVQIITTYGLLDGKQQKAVETISQGKNVGKSNETTPLEQAKLEAQSQWEKKSKKSYVQTLEDAEAGVVDTNFITGGIDPMLAHKYEEQGHKIVWPAFVQPKLDGHRCIAIIQDGKATLWSRTRKPILSLPHIQKQLEDAFGAFHSPVILDGELYNHDYRDKFEQLTSKIRQSTPQPGAEVVQYWVYDIVEERTQDQRVTGLEILSASFGPNIVLVPSTEVEDEEEMIRIFGVYIKSGFEGLMVRNSAGTYKNKRSYDLQKVKTFQDSEFEVVGIEQGKGKMAGLAMFVCNSGNANGDTFRVKMKGALESLRDYYENPEPWIGKQLTVKYQGLSADGIPRFPVAERFREDV